MEFISLSDDTLEMRVEEPNVENEFISDLRDWAITNNISQAALDRLLALLRKNKMHGEVLLPKSSKTLLRISSKKVATKKLSNNYEYWHFGIQQILTTLRNSGLLFTNPVKLSINIDGMPIENSGNTQFWPILCTI